MTWALLAAVAGTAGYGAGSVLQAAGVRRASGPAAIVQPAYLAGLGCDGAAWVLSLIALQRLPLFTVQALLAGSLAVTVVLARIIFKTRLRVRDGAAVIVVGLALAGVAAASGAESAGPPPTGFAASMLIGLTLVAALTVALYRFRRPILLAVLAGAGFSGAALGARGIQLGGGIGGLAASPVAWAIIGFALLGVLAYSRALEFGDVGASTAVLWVVEVVVPGTIGVLVLGDDVRPGWALPAIIALAAAITGCIVLATSPTGPDS